MIKSIALIIIPFMVLTGCVTPDKSEQSQNIKEEKPAGNFVVTDHSVLMNGAEILDLKTEFIKGDNGDSAYFELTRHNREIDKVFIGIDVMTVSGSDELNFYNIVTDTYSFDSDTISFKGTQVSGSIVTSFITMLQIMWSDGSMSFCMEPSQVQKMVDKSIEDYFAEKFQGKEPLKTWLTEGVDLLLITEQDKLSVMNPETFEKMLISKVTSEWIDKQPEDGFKLTLDFSDETGGLIDYINAGASFYEKDKNRGGQTNNFEEFKRGFSNVLIADQKDLDAEYHVTPIMGWSLWVDYIDFKPNQTDHIRVNNLAKLQRSELNLNDGFTFIGDRNNPFSLIKHSGKAPESWVSDFNKVDLVWQNNLVTAVNKETGEKIDLVRVRTKWAPESSKTGEFSFIFEDLSDGMVVGGSLRTTLTFGGYLPRGNQVNSAFRFDAGETVTFHKYLAGKEPSLIYSVNVSDQEKLKSNPLRETFGTIAFRDGNVLLFHNIRGD
jgi:hypothetical protein